MPDNANSVVFITAGASGIGTACARLLMATGVTVVAGVRDPHKGELLRQQLGSALVPVQLDVTDSASIAAAIDVVQATLSDQGGRLAGIVNNATNERHGPIELLPMAFLRDEIEVDYLGTAGVVKAALPLLRRARGRIVNFSSMNGRCVFRSIGANSAAKYAIEALSDALRLELAPWGIEVALVEPGAIATPLWEKALQKFVDLPTHVPADQLQLYYPDWPAAVAHAAEDKKRFLRNALPPERVATAVLHALTARRPKARYVVGKDARAVLFMKWLLPDRWFDQIAMLAFNDQ